MKRFCLIRLLLSLLLVTGAFYIHAAIYIDSVRTTPSSCANNGVITVYAHSSTSLLYSVIAGPDIRPQQSGSSFSGLPNGLYSVLVTDYANDTVIVAATVAGNYTFPDFSPTFSNPFCSGGSDGIIVGNPIQGQAPFNWVLTNTGTGSVITQASDSFFNLSAGNFNLRQYDTCFNFATYSITLVNPVDSFVITEINNSIFTCDSVRLGIDLFVYEGNYFPPYTIQVQTHNGTYHHVLDLSTYSSDWYPTFTEDVGGISYGDWVNITITDACGHSVSSSDVISGFSVANILTSVVQSCQFDYQADFYLNEGNVTYFPTPVTVVFTNYYTGVYVDSFVTVDTINHSSYFAYSPILPPGQVYNIKLTDACGNVFTQTITWPSLPTPAAYPSISNIACLDSVASFGVTWENTFSSVPTFQLLSGPSVIESSKPHFQYSDSIIYPVTLMGYGGLNGFAIQITNLAAGTYYYRAFDTCGHVVTDSFTILPSDLSDHYLDMTYIRGCPGQNAILIAEPGQQSATTFLTGNLPNGASSITVYPIPDTVPNISQGPYYLSANFGAPGESQFVSEHLTCLSGTDTIVIPPYQLPEIAYATQIKCNGTVNVGLLPDSTKGVAPYSYQILSGPQTYTTQSSNFFTFTQPGIYVARISDTCGFAQTFTFSVDTLSFQQVIKVGSSCLGDQVTLTSQSSPYATYTWQRPNGTLYTGDSLVINPVTNNDYGVYIVTKYVNVNNCRDTVQLSYTLTSSANTNIVAYVCNGAGVLFAGQTYTTPGVYYDTIQTAQCDSVVILTINTGVPVYTSEVHTMCAGQSFNFGGRVLTNAGFYHDTLQTANGCDSIHALDLIVNDILYDSAAINLCNGQSITVGVHTYNTTGIYYDTLVTSGGCDSLYVLNLTVGGIKYDSSAQNICSGQSITVGPHTYNSTGIYRDTFATAGCDSVYILNLIVVNRKYDSVSETICTGQSIAVGQHVYNTTGIYYDTIASAGGCDSIYILNLKVVNVMYDSVTQSICSGQAFTVGSHTYTTPGIYHDTLVSAGGCDSIYVLNLEVNKIKRDTINITFCTGDSAVINGLTYTTAGIYTDTFATATCDSLRTINITVTPTPAIQIAANSTTITAGDTVQLSVTESNQYAYYWSSLAQLSSQYIANPFLIAYQSAWVKVSVDNPNNCIASDSLYITVAPCVGSLYAPNAFSPNGDGHNDEYRVYAKCATLQKLLIFNRWGEKVWETTDMEQGWNGYYKGVLQPEGVYVFFLTYTDTGDRNEEVKELKGSITLLR